MRLECFIPSGENYHTCPYDGTALKLFTYDLLASITVTKNSTNATYTGLTMQASVELQRNCSIPVTKGYTLPQ